MSADYRVTISRHQDWQCRYLVKVYQGGVFRHLDFRFTLRGAKRAARQWIGDMDDRLIPRCEQPGRIGDPLLPKDPGRRDESLHGRNITPAWA